MIEEFKNKLIYLASPYTSGEPDPVRQNDEQLRRTAMVSRLAGKMLKRGYNVFSPIAHSATIVENSHEPPHDVWMRLDLEILKRCDVLMVFQLHGWDTSSGIAQEMELAEKHGIPICSVDMNGIVCGDNLFYVRI